MALRDTAIVGFAETKIVEKTDRDIWELGAEILDDLLTSTGFEKQEIDGLVLSASMTGAANPFWSQTTADQLGLELDFCQTVDIGGSSPLGALARASAAIDAGLCTTAMLLFADTQAAENNSRMRSFNGGMDGALRAPGAAGRVRAAVQALRASLRARLPHARQAGGGAARPRACSIPMPSRSCGSRSPSTTTSIRG